MEKTLNLVKNDPWLEPFAGAITGRHQHVLDKEAELTNKGKQTLSDFASGYLYFGLHRTDKDGLSVNGRPMLLIFIWWVHLIIGRKKQPIS